MNSILVVYDSPLSQLRNSLVEIFSGQPWIESFLASDHHGFQHGEQVWDACRKLIDKLTADERKQFLTEGQAISVKHPYEGAMVALEVAAVFHDCGRFNDHGKVVREEQVNHHLLSARRAQQFCEGLDLKSVIPFSQDAILSHDYQSPDTTEHLTPPKSTIGKIVQSADQMGWFHPSSLDRTLAYNKDLPFYDPGLQINERLAWKPHSTPTRDTVTVMIAGQLFGPRDPERFGIESARLKVESYIPQLEKRILELAHERGVEREVRTLIEVYRKRSHNSA